MMAPPSDRKMMPQALDRLIDLIAKIEVEKYLQEVNALASQEGRNNQNESSNLRAI